MTPSSHIPHVLLGAAKAPPAGGAALGQVIGVTAAAAILIGALLFFGLGHRSGRFSLLEKIATFSARLGGLPTWVALPTGLAAGSLICAVFGFYWDVSLHIDNGRDPGPLANPSHYFILAGLFGIFSAGWLAIVLPKGKPSPVAVRITRDWYAPVGGVMLMACASFALIGFPLDDVFHRLFGQDVTLWGPTHLMMLGGAAMSLIGIMALLAETRLAANAGGGQAPPPFVPRFRVPAALLALQNRRVRLVLAAGGLLIGLSIFQGEFDFGVPQFRLLFEPVLIAFAAATALVTARTLGGRGAALAAAAFFLVIRGSLTLLIGPGFGETTVHFPLYVVEALIVEAVALGIGTNRTYRFGVVSGALIGSAGVLAEWGWSHVWMPIAWPGHIVPAAIALAMPVAVAGGVIGAFLAGALRLRPEIASVPRAWVAVGASLLVVAATIGFLLPTSVPAARVSASLTDVHPAPGRQVAATVRFHPASVARNADWLQEIAWQGGGKLVVSPLRQVGDGVYRTPKPLPVYGEWKSSIRLHRGSTMASIPVFMPGDAAIPAAKVPATASLSRPLQADREILQRERKHGVPGWLWGMAGAVVLGFTLVLLALIGWGLVRLNGPAAPRPSRARAAQSGSRTAAGAT